jgi:hypothetical protein
MATPIKEEAGKTIVMVKVPVGITIQMSDEDAKEMSQMELAGLLDEIIDHIEMNVGARVAELAPGKWMNRIPLRFTVSRHWDELPIDDMEIGYSEGDFFQRRGDEEAYE